MKYLSIPLILVLAACGGEDDSSTPATLADLVGVWDGSETVEQKRDELYTVIQESGDFVSYDYMGDSADNGENCYEKSNGASIADQGAGEFIISSQFAADETVSITVSGNSMSLFGEDDEGAYRSNAVKSSLLESDFTPLCAE